MAQILIVDDDPTLRMTLSRVLKKQGYEVTTAGDGEAGLAAAIAQPPSLIICDWMMPKMDGIEVCQRVKAIEALANSYFILLTSRDEVVDLVQGLESGADDFLGKPPNLSELQARVRAGLRVHQANRELQERTQQLEKELSQAAEYVKSLLPAPMVGKVTTNSFFLPSAALGGDCFDYFWLDDRRFAFYLLDVSGHGVGSALLSVSVLNLLRSRSLRHSSDVPVDFAQPGEVLTTLNHYFQMSAHQDMYFTMWYGVWEPHTRQLRYGCGGHPPAVAIVGGAGQKLQVPGVPIGMVPDLEYDTATIHLPPQTRLYLYSDGIYEIPTGEGKIWGIDALLATLVQACRGMDSPLAAVLRTTQGLLPAGTAPDDDISLLEIVLL